MNWHILALIVMVWLLIVAMTVVFNAVVDHFVDKWALARQKTQAPAVSDPFSDVPMQVIQSAPKTRGAHRRTGT